MTKTDTPLLAPGDLGTATALLTRLPVRFDGDRAAHAAWAYPLAGLFVAALCCTLGAIATALSVPAPLTAALVLGCGIVITGALHEDGLADTADGLWGGWTVEKRLTIMKDSHIGAYGVIALVLSLLIRWQALSLIISAGLLWPVLLCTAPLSRAAMVAVMHALPHARDTGLSHSTGRPHRGTTLIALGFGTASTLLLGLWMFPVLILVATMTLAVTGIARAKINGQTGDILGATQQLTDMTALITIAALL